MTSIIHLSDLHFGPQHNSHLDEIILRDITALHPDAVIVSGDFTMRARHHEFDQAREFLSQIDKPLLTVPGNHDQPLFSPIERFTRQYARYQAKIHPSIDSTLSAPGWFVIGLNDNRPILPGGFWSGKQRQWIETQAARAPQDTIKVIVTHHQLNWGGKWRPAGFWNPQRTLAFLARNGVELVLNGHTHVPVSNQDSSGVIVARAGTAASGRLRHGNVNSYNLISVDSSQFSIFVRQYDERAEAFVSVRAFTFPRRKPKP